MTDQNGKRRVVITGLGVISSIGIGWQEFWESLIMGKSGISRVESFDTSKYDRHYAGEIKGFDITSYFGNRNLSHLGPASKFALVATKLALQDAKLSYENLKDLNVAVAIGTTMGELQVLEMIENVVVSKGHEQIDARMLPIYPSNGISSSIARNLGIRGDNFLTANACSAGNYAFGRAFDDIKIGRADMVVAGGVDAFSKLILGGFMRMLAVAPEKCRPFDKNREGMMVGEGAGIVIIETFESAQRRNASIYAEILGYGLSCDAHNMTTPDSKGMKKAILKALKESDVKPENVDYISAHGTGTEQNDKNESQAVKEIFYTSGRRIPMSSVKSMLGHTMGAASAIETIVCSLALKYNVIPPTINYEDSDPECDIDCVPNKTREKKVSLVLNNSFAFGGNNACLVLKKI